MSSAPRTSASAASPSPLASESLISARAFIFFALGAAALLFYAVPSDYELAIFRLASFQGKGARELLLKASESHPNDASVLRRLADTYENEGRFTEAAALVKRLIDLRPKNLGYLQRYTQLLNGMGRAREALAMRERAMDLKLVVVTRAELSDLAQGYEWLEENAESARVYERLWKSGLYAAADTTPILRVFLGMRMNDQAEAFAQEAVNAGKADRLLLYAISHIYLEQSNYSKGMEFLVRYAGAPIEPARRAWDSLEYVTVLPRTRILAEPRILNELVWLYIEHGRKPLAAQLLTQLRDQSLLDKPLHFTLVELYVEQKLNEQGLAELDTLARRTDLVADDWRKIAERYLWSGQTKKTQLILKSLIESKDPSAGLFEAAPPRSARPGSRGAQWRLSPSFRPGLGSHRNLSSYCAPGSRSRLPRVMKESAERAYQDSMLLLAAYDGNSQTDESIDLLEDLLRKMQTGEAVSSAERESQVRELLAERQLWQAHPQAVLKTLAPRPGLSQSPKLRALRALALGEISQTAEAKKIAHRITRLERATLSKEYAQRLEAIDREPLPEPEVTQSKLEQSAVAPEPEWVPPNDYFVIEGGYFSLTPGVMVSDDATVPSLIAEAVFRRPGQAWSPTVQLQGVRVLENSIQMGAIWLGAEHRFESSRYRVEAGAVLNGRYIVPQARIHLVGSGFLGMDYYSVLGTLADPYTATLGLSAAGVSETRVGFYAERQFGDWVKVTGELIARSAHLGHNLNQGTGEEVSLRIPLGRTSWLLHAGPWGYVSRFTTSNDDLVNLLARQVSILGGYAILGVVGNDRVNGHVAIGLGQDFSADDGNQLASFGEIDVERFLSRRPGLGLKFSYGYYSSRAFVRPGAGTHVAQLTLFKEF